MGKASRGKRERVEATSSTRTPVEPRQSFIVQPLPILLLLAFLATLIYSNTFSVPFYFDDKYNIVGNAWIKDPSNLLDFSGTRYVGFLTFALNYHFGRLHIFGYHLINLLIHILNGFLVCRLVLLLFRAVHGSPSTADDNSQLMTRNSQLASAPWIALATALLFITHPIQTQAVTYIVQRFASLVTLFYLLTVVCYLKWRLAAPDTRGRYLWYTGAFLSTILAMKTKENGFTLPLMLLLVEFVFFRPLNKKRWLALIPFLLTLPIIPLSRGAALGDGEAEGFAYDTTEISRFDYLFTQFRVIVTYFRLLVLPINQNLDYDYPVFRSFFIPSVFASFLFLSFLLGLAVYLLWKTKSRLIAFGILWFFLTLSVESSIIPIKDVIFEHRLYLPSIGIFLILSVLILGRKPGRSLVWRVVGLGAIILASSVITYQRNLVWQDEVTFWQDVVSKAPKKTRPHGNLGDAYEERGRYEAAIQEYLLVLKLEPNNIKAYNNLGIAYKNLGHLDEAIESYQRVLKLDPGFAMAHSNLGTVYAEQGRYEAAIREYKLALELNKDLGDAHHNLANAYAIQGQFDGAIQEYRMALKLEPHDPDVHYHLGLTYMLKGNREAARREFEETLKIKPGYIEARQALGELYK